MVEALLHQLSNNSGDRGDRAFEDMTKESEPPLLSEVPPDMMVPKQRSKVKVQHTTSSKQIKSSSMLLKKKQGTKKALGINNNYLGLVEEAITNVKDRNGVSIQSIKSYLSKKYGLNMSYTANYISKSLKKGLEKGMLANGRSKQRYKFSPVYAQQIKDKAKKDKKDNRTKIKQKRGLLNMDRRRGRVLKVNRAVIRKRLGKTKGNNSKSTTLPTTKEIPPPVNKSKK